jgi:hypothetical protein
LAVFKAVITWLSYIFHFLAALFLLGMAGLGLAFGPRNLNLEAVPWSGDILEYVLLAGSLFGLLSIALAIVGRLRFLFLLWSLAVAATLTKGYIFSGYRFDAGKWRHAVYLIAAVWVAVAGAWFQVRRNSGRGPRRYRVK